METLGTYPTSKWIVVARFICAVVLHMALQDEIKQGLDVMKYTLNHSWRFDNWHLAFLCGFLQTIVIVCVEVVNFIAIMSSQEITSVVMNFLALVVISEFDDFFYQALNSEDNIYLSEPGFADIFKIERTTSRRATDDIPEHQLTKMAINIPDEAERVQMEAAGLIPRTIHQEFA